MVSCICSTYCWRILPSLTRGSKAVRARASRSGCHKPRECFKVQSQLTDIWRHLVDGEGAGACGGGSVGAGVVWVSDVCGVCWDGGATGWGVNNTWAWNDLASGDFLFKTYSRLQTPQHMFHLNFLLLLNILSLWNMFHRWKWNLIQCTVHWETGQ